MRARHAVLYCTVNGVCSNTNGLGRQTKTLLSALERRRGELLDQVGPFEVHIACPQPGPHVWGYDPIDLDYAAGVLGGWGGTVHSLAYDTSAPFWSVRTWQELCEAAARCAAELAERYDELLVVGVDTPFAGLGRALAAYPSAHRRGVHIVLAFYSTALIVERAVPGADRVAWERQGVASANTLPRVWVGDVGRFLTAHLRHDYGLDPTRLVPFASSLDLASPDLCPMPTAEARRVAAGWNVPLERPVVLTVGRTDPTKGIDLLIHALGPLRERVHAVIVAVRSTAATRSSTTTRGASLPSGCGPHSSPATPASCRERCAAWRTRAWWPARRVGKCWPMCPSRWRCGPETLRQLSDRFLAQTGQLHGTLPELKRVRCRHADILPGGRSHLTSGVRATGPSS